MGLILCAVDYVLARVEIHDVGETVYTDQPRAGIAETIALAKAAGHEVVVVTNQAGPAYRAMLGGKHYPTVKDVCIRLIAIAKATGTADCTWCLATWDSFIWEKIDPERFDVYEARRREMLPKINARFTYWFEHAGMPSPGISAHPAWRMPETQMLQDILTSAKMEPSDAVMIAPDNSREARAARAVGMSVIVPDNAREHFEREKEEEERIHSTPF